MRLIDSALPLAVAALLAAPVARAADAAHGAGADLAIRFVAAGDGFGGDLVAGEALLDVGPVSAAWERLAQARRAASPSSLIRRRVGVKVTSRSGRRGFVSVRAFLNGPALKGTVKIDGAVLTTAPRIVDAQAPIGSTVGHVIEIEVPASEPAGAFSADIVWEVEQ